MSDTRRNMDCALPPEKMQKKKVQSAASSLECGGKPPL